MQINRTRWDPVTSYVALIADAHPDADAIAKGSASLAVGRAGMLFRIINNAVEASNVGWPEDTVAEAKFDLIRGTVVAHSTVIPATFVPRTSRTTPIPTVVQPISTTKP